MFLPSIGVLSSPFSVMGKEISAICGGWRTEPSPKSYAASPECALLIAPQIRSCLPEPSCRLTMALQRTRGPSQRPRLRFAVQRYSCLTANGHRVAELRSLDGTARMKYLILAFLLATGCKYSSPQAAAPNTSSRFYQLGMVEGTKHAKERPQSSLMLWPADSTNWSSRAEEDYRSGYLSGLRTTP